MQKKRSLEEALKRQVSTRSQLILRRLRKYLIAGILVTAPTALTLYLAYIFIIFVDAQVAKLLPQDWQPAYGESIFPGSGLIFALLFFVLTGWLAANVFGKLFIEASEFVMQHMPFVRTLYNAIKQVIETLIGSQAKAFREVVMVEFPRKDVWTLGFVTGVTEGEIKGNLKGQEMVNIFVPTAPSPVNGFMLFVPRQEIIPLRMSIEEGIKMVVSMGILSPRSMEKQIPADL